MARSSDSFFLLALFKDKTFQAREVKRVIYLSTIYLLVTTVMLAAFYQQMLGQLVAGETPMLFVSEDINLLNEQIPAMTTVLGQWVVVMLIVNIIITSILGVYILRKLGHPLMAIKRGLRDIGDGKLNTKLRDSDSKEFAEITDAFNTALVKIHEKIAEAKADIHQLDTQTELTQKDMQSTLRKCSETLDYFQTAASNDDDSQSSVAS